MHSLQQRSPPPRLASVEVRALPFPSHASSSVSAYAPSSPTSSAAATSSFAFSPSPSPSSSSEDNSNSSDDEFFSSMDSEAVQKLLRSWGLAPAFGAYFESMHVTGELLLELRSDEIDLARCPATTTQAHVRMLFKKIQRLQKDRARQRAKKLKEKRKKKKKTRQRLQRQEHGRARGGQHWQCEEADIVASKLTHVVDEHMFAVPSPLVAGSPISFVRNPSDPGPSNQTVPPMPEGGIRKRARIVRRPLAQPSASSATSSEKFASCSPEKLPPAWLVAPISPVALSSRESRCHGFERQRDLGQHASSPYLERYLQRGKRLSPDSSLATARSPSHVQSIARPTIAELLSKLRRDLVSCSSSTDPSGQGPGTLLRQLWALQNGIPAIESELSAITLSDVELLLRAMSMFPRSADTIEYGLATLLHGSIVETLTPRHRRQAALLAVRALSSHSGTEGVVESAVAFLGTTFSLDLGSKAVITTILDILRKLGPSNWSIALHGLRLLAQICARDSLTNKDIVMKLGGAKTTLDLLQRHDGQCSVLAAGLWVLENLCFYSLSRSLRIVQLSGVKVIASVLQKHGHTSQDLAATALAALAAMVTNFVTWMSYVELKEAKTSIQSSLEAVVASGAATFALHTLKSQLCALSSSSHAVQPLPDPDIFRVDDNVVAEALALLAALGRDVSMCEIMLDAGVLELLLHTLLRHPTVAAELTKRALLGLECAAKTCRGAQLVAEGGAVAVVLQVLNESSTSVSVAHVQNRFRGS
eukprot:INCI7628.7.p1 GENE.INCI7628.7~~INCI7628.7.p1  ORF type:complete len:761 (-),score=104.63 INCI7628.7:1765-4047(-)